MAKPSTTLEWCVVRLGDDLNWWVEEVSDTIHWDTDGLSIIDPRQLNHLIELVEPLRDYGFDPNVMERAFIPFRIGKDMGKNRVRLHRIKDSILESEDKLFVLPDTIDDENSAYADLLDHITRLRVKMLNDLFDFDQRLTVDEVEEEIREEANAGFMEGEAVHCYKEITSILDYMPAGWEGDEDEDAPRAKKVEGEGEEEFPDLEEDEEALKDDNSLRWEEEDDEKKETAGSGGESKEKDEEKEDDAEDGEEEEEEDGAPSPRRRKR